MDGSSCNERVGDRLILTNPIGEDITYSLHEELISSNNELENKALIA